MADFHWTIPGVGVRSEGETVRFFPIFFFQGDRRMRRQWFDLLSVAPECSRFQVGKVGGHSTESTCSPQGESSVKINHELGGNVNE